MSGWRMSDLTFITLRIMQLFHTLAGADGSWIALLPGSSKSGVSAARHPFCADLTVSSCMAWDTLLCHVQ